jgi:hypothetical protein
MQIGEARRWMVAITLGALGWTGAAGAGSAQDTPPPGKVRVRLTSPDELALKLMIVPGPEGSTGDPGCALPCEVDLAPGQYRVRFVGEGLMRSWPQTLHVTDAATYRVRYHSRHGWRALGGILLVCSITWAVLLAVALAMTGPAGSGDENLMLFAVAGLGPIVTLGLPWLLIPDRARLVPAR